MKRWVMLGGEGESTYIVFHHLREKLGLETLILESKSSRYQIFRRRITRLGLLRTLGQLAFVGVVRPWLKRSAKERINEICRLHGMNRTPPTNGVVRVSSVNDPATIKLLQELAPEIVMVNGTRIIHRDVLAAVKATFINLHVGITPAYRGVHGGYWALTQKDAANFGGTVHLIDPGIDTGAVLFQGRSVKPTAADNFSSYPYLQMASCLDGLCEVLQRPHPASSALPQQGGASRLWSHPTIAEYFRCRWSLGVK